MVMTPYLDRPVARISDFKGHVRPVLVEDYLAGCWKNLAGYRVSRTSGNWVMNTHEFSAIGKRRFHLHLRNHLGDPFHHLVTAQNLAAFRHEFSNRLAITRCLQHEIRNHRNTLGIVELYTSLHPLPGDDRGKGDHQLVLFTRGQVHKFLRPPAIFNMTTSSALGMVLNRVLVRLAGESCARQSSNPKSALRQTERRSIQLPTWLHNRIPAKKGSLAKTPVAFPDR